ncbi:hypothetical protein [Exiguobacterium sp. s193]|uniref:hypothetical protein n=1 Tax=Exiguobacterium sp. s193 TaxID=2751207 RepID=UPI001BE90DE8|nr:hypothetical protein [Exiguobacterium sp. s193]
MQLDGQNHFWLFEKDGRTLYTFHGIMGERLEEPKSEQKFSRFFNLDAYTRELVVEKQKDGYYVVQDLGGAGKGSLRQTLDRTLSYREEL